jgi:tellurite resistance protein
MQFFPEIPLSADASRALVRGLYSLARADGLHPREQQLLQSMAQELGMATLLPISPAQLKQALETEEQRLLFAKMALLMVHVEGGITAQERGALRSFFDGLELSAADLLGLEFAVAQELLALPQAASS